MSQPDDSERLRQQYAEIATLAGGLAHEIRNPLSTIRMNLELLSEDIEDSQEPHRHRMHIKIDRIRKECAHLEEILTAFLQFAGAGELELEETDLNNLIQEFIDFYRPQANDYGIEISPHFDSHLPRVRVDKSLMRQVFMNLVLNAQQAMPEGGLLEIQTHQQGKGVVLEIIDTGIGMDERARSKMFQVFFSTKPSGSGLGLPTVRKIVEAHGGTIDCESEPGRGTKFAITLPADEE